MSDWITMSPNQGRDCKSQIPTVSRCRLKKMKCRMEILPLAKDRHFKDGSASSDAKDSSNRPSSPPALSAGLSMTSTEGRCHLRRNTHLIIGSRPRTPPLRRLSPR